MDDPSVTCEEFRKALHQLQLRVVELSDKLNDFAARVAAVWMDISSDFQAAVESITEAVTVYEKIHNKKLPRPSYRMVRTYGYIKPFRRNLPYQRRRY